MNDDTIVTGEVSEELDKDVREQVEAEEDAFLEKMEMEDAAPDDDPTPPGPQRGPDGKFTKKETAAEPEDTDEPKVEATEDDVNPEDYRKAIRALQRVKVPDDVINSRSKKDILEWGMWVAEEQAKVDGYGNRIKELEQDKPTATDTQPSEPALDRSALEPVLNAVKESYGEELSEPLDKISKMLADQFDSKLKEQRETLQQLQANVVRQQMADARAKFSDDWGLDDETRYARVEDAMRTLDRTGEFGNITDLTEAACRYALAGDEIARLKSNLSSEHVSRKNGQSTTSNRKSKPAPVTDEQGEDRLLTAIFDGDKEEVQRAASDMGHKKRRRSWEDLSGIIK